MVIFYTIVAWIVGVISHWVYVTIKEDRANAEQVTGTDEELALAYEESVLRCRRNVLGHIRAGDLSDADQWQKRELQARKKAEEYRAKCLPAHSDGAYR